MCYNGSVEIQHYEEGDKMAENQVNSDQEEAQNDGGGG